MRPRSRWVSTPANGEFCRSSHPLSDRDVMASSSSSTGPSRSRGHLPSQRAATPEVRRRETTEVHPSTAQGPLWIGYEPPRHRLMEPRLRTWSLVSSPTVFLPP